MGIKSNESNRHLSAPILTQVKVLVAAEIAAGFKAKCAADGISMTSVIYDCMRDRIGMKESKKPDAADVSTRQKRRKEIKKLIQRIEYVMDAESSYLENIPDNLSGSCHYEAAEETVSALEEAREILCGAYE